MAPFGFDTRTRFDAYALVDGSITPFSNILCTSLLSMFRFAIGCRLRSCLTGFSFSVSILCFIMPVHPRSSDVCENTSLCSRSSLKKTSFCSLSRFVELLTNMSRR